MHKVLFVAAEPLSEALTWSQGHRYTFRVRPNTYSQGRMLAERAARLPYRKWAVIGPNYEYGRRAWETFWARLKELKPDVQVVGEHWPTLGKLEPGGYVTALLSQQPEALYVSLFGSDWLAFAREAGKRGLFEKTFTVGILLGEPEYMDPLKLEAPEGMLVTGYPWYGITLPAHKAFVAQVHEADRSASRGRGPGRVRHVPVHLRSHPQGADDGHRGSDRRPGVAEGRDAHRPHHLPAFRSPVHHGRVGGHDEAGHARGVAVMAEWEYVPGENVLPSEAEVRRMREAGNRPASAKPVIPHPTPAGARATPLRGGRPAVHECTPPSTPSRPVRMR